MAAEVQVSYGTTGATLYFVVRNATGSIWNGTAFETFVTANWGTYDVSLTEQGTASGYYVGNFPSTITAGIYNIVAKRQSGGSPLETDATVATGEINWDGTVVMPLSNVATSGQVGQLAPMRIARGVAISGFTFHMVSAADHITNFTSGVISGQVARDGGSFGVLQSGTVTEMGLGFYRCNLTSGDLAAGTLALLFTGAGVSGGTADQRSFSIVTQRVSGF